MHRTLKSTDTPTKTVDALKAGLKMEEKLTRLPMHRISGSGKRPLAERDDLQGVGISVTVATTLSDTYRS